MRTTQGDKAFLYHWTLRIVLVITLVYLLLPTVPAIIEWGIILLLLITLGIPHGANDFLVFLNIRRQEGHSARFWGFLFRYLGLMTAYAFLWWWSPVLSFILFLFIAAYHFGQSNWHYAVIDAPVLRWLTFFLWGAFQFAVPTLWLYPEQGKVLLEAITQQSLPEWSSLSTQIVAWILFGVNIGLILLLKQYKKISQKEATNEVIQLAFLFWLYISAPLVLSFTLYFVGWHALSTVADQYTVFNQSSRKFTLGRYIKKALPFSFLAIAGMAAIIFFLPGGWNKEQIIATSIQLIAILTLPHALLMDRLFHYFPADRLVYSHHQWKNHSE
jgi:Brp/Blh family beta-carotene 15,15'-monooxygenase